MMYHPYGFRIVGAPTEARRLITWAAAFGAYAACDQRAEVDREAYLSAFTFGDGMKARADGYGRLDVRGFDGACAATFVWFDLDRERLDDALRDARRLVVHFDERYDLDDGRLLCFFSGSKGFHLGLPASLWIPEATEDFHRATRRFAEARAEAAGVAIDTGVYDRVRAFRAPNSRHPKTDLHKRRLSLDELMHLSVDRIVQLAEGPEPFEVPRPAERCEQAVVDWQAAVEQVQRQSAAALVRRANVEGATLNRATLDFLRDGATEGERHRLLFSAAANLAEFGCPAPLAHALLTEAGLDSGLPPKEVKRQIECGLAAKGGAA